jgi:glycosyltransferase involved in cell wall biosynthesis
MEKNAMLNSSGSFPEFSEKPIKKDSPLSISVVIIAKDAQGTIPYTLDSLRKQSRKPDEIIVVVPTPNDNTVIALKDYPEVHIAIDEKRRRGAARALGVQQTSGAIIAFIDAECIAHSEWLKALEIIYLEKKEVMAQGGPIIGFRYFGQPAKDPSKSDTPIKYVKFLPTANFSVRREAAILVGNFNEKLHEGEDLDFCVKLAEHNIHVAFNPNAIVRHMDKSTFDLLKRYFNYGKSRSRVLFLHPRSTFSAALIATVSIVSIPIAIFALLIQRYDILFVVVGLPLLRMIYNFQKWRNWQIRPFLAREFVHDFLLAYTLYTGFVVCFFPSLFQRSKYVEKLPRKN